MNTNGSTYYNDNNSFCCQVLRKNITSGHLPEGYVDERDIREVHATDFIRYSHVHLFAGIGVFSLGLQRAGYPSSLRTLTGGFPCVDISNAGKRAGIEGAQSGLWKEMYRLIQETAALHEGFDYILVENVSALTHRGLGTVLSDLAEAGYDAVWGCLRASDFGAPHQRERIFVVAYPNGDRQRIGQDQQKRGSERQRASNLSYDGSQGVMADPSRSGWQELNASSIAGASGHTAWCNLAPGKTGLVESSTSRREWQHSTTGSEEGTQPLFEQSGAGNAQPRICGNAYGAAAWMDRYQWPARPGQPQYDYEPSRIITGKQQNRVARLKALGNAIVVPCVEYIGRCIVAREMDGVA